MNMRVYVNSCIKSCPASDFESNLVYAVNALHITGNKVKSIFSVLTRREKKVVKKAFDIDISKNKMKKKKPPFLLGAWGK